MHSRSLLVWQAWVFNRIAKVMQCHTPIECSVNYSLVNVYYLMHARTTPGMAGGPSSTISTMVPVVGPTTVVPIELDQEFSDLELTMSVVIYLCKFLPQWIFFSQLLLFFIAYKDIGLTSYLKHRLNTGQNLTKPCFFTPTHGLLLLVKIFGFLKSAKILGLILSKIQVKHLSKSWGIS